MDVSAEQLGGQRKQHGREARDGKAQIAVALWLGVWREFGWMLASCVYLAHSRQVSGCCLISIPAELADAGWHTATANHRTLAQRICALKAPVLRPRFLR
jgi:hypothetical protein